MFGILLVVGGLFLLAVGAVKIRPAYHVYRGEIQDVLEVERFDGPVELEGTATELEDTIVAPLSGTPCLASEYEVEEYQSSGNSSSWNTVDSGSAAVSFRLEDETASVRVDPAGCRLALSTDRTIEVGGGESEPAAIREFLESTSDLESENSSLDLGLVEIATGNDRRYHERRLDVGGDAYVLGRSRYDVGARETMRDISAVVEDGEETPAFVVSDSPPEVAVWLLAKPALWWLIGGVLALFVGVQFAVAGI
ncbi:E3 ubiquitin ligase [Natrarchaeobius sp. A-rgal3]|uniref:E3 ubiquitin ligase n=1 Tax=Natrarchaeobius versutus TaxID=1679078 RepID=UPI00350F73BA